VSSTDKRKPARGKGERVRRALSAEGWVFGTMMIFFMLTAPIYYFSTHEPVGTTGLGLAMLLNMTLFVYLAIIGREIGGPRPEDDPEGEIMQGAGTLGFFPPKSIWPFWCALAITVIFLGPVFGWWISLIGLAVGYWAASGLIFEYYRGDYAH
jgi:hypothetical protein